MRFTFAATNKYSKALYLIGLPAVIFTVLDRFVGWQILDQTTNMQLFFLGAIAVTIAGVINLSVTILQNFKK